MACDKSKYEEAMAALAAAEAAQAAAQQAFDESVTELGEVLDCIFEKGVLYYACLDAEAGMESHSADLAEALEDANANVEDAQAAADEEASKLCACYHREGGMPLDD